MALVRAITTVSVADPTITDKDGNPTARRVIHENEAFDSKDPLVKEYPWAFAADVERATAAPGEKRNVSKR